MSELGEAFPFYKAYVKDVAGIPAPRSIFSGAPV